MIPLGRLQEFGFTDVDRLPRQLTKDAVTLSLPSALQRGVAPVVVEITHGLMIPLAVTGGMIINGDGKVLHIGHKDSDDNSSPLRARFIKDIPYDVRVEVVRIMRRAVQVDPSLDDIWQRVCATWIQWFPPKPGEFRMKRVGVFRKASQAWKGVAGLIAQAADDGSRRVRVVVEQQAQFQQGWMGEEILVEEGVAAKMNCFLRMQQVLRDPVFHPRSTFKLWQEHRGPDVFKLVVVPPWNAGAREIDAAGIELQAI